ncbi:hypothetical protein MY11210_003085 [Beauveria gryllotalpidicola]
MPIPEQYTPFRKQSRTAFNAGEAHEMDPDLQCIG